MIGFTESNFYKALQDFFINNNKDTFLQMLSEFYNRTENIIKKDEIQDELIKELRELYIMINEKGIDENYVKEKVNLFLQENNEKIQKIISQLTNKASRKDLEVERKRIDNLTTIKADKTEIDVERKRIDNLTRLNEGSTTGDAELTDARIAQNGMVFSNVGDNIRNIDRILNTTVLNYETIANYNYEYISANKDSNGMIYINYIFNDL